jgi:hypothetical protein
MLLLWSLYALLKKYAKSPLLGLSHPLSSLQHMFECQFYVANISAACAKTLGVYHLVRTHQLLGRVAVSLRAMDSAIRANK